MARLEGRIIENPALLTGCRTVFRPLIKSRLTEIVKQSIDPAKQVRWFHKKDLSLAVNASSHLETFKVRLRKKDVVSTPKIGTARKIINFDTAKNKILLGYGRQWEIQSTRRRLLFFAEYQESDADLKYCVSTECDGRGFVFSTHDNNLSYVVMYEAKTVKNSMALQEHSLEVPGFLVKGIAVEQFDTGFQIYLIGPDGVHKYRIQDDLEPITKDPLKVLPYRATSIHCFGQQLAIGCEGRIALLNTITDEEFDFVDIPGNPISVANRHCWRYIAAILDDENNLRIYRR
ncbi:hypothetical protein ACFLZN_02330 [Nanoarchaeota archaeon]